MKLGLGLSLTLNVVLVVLLVVMASLGRRRSMQMMADVTRAEARMNAEILDALESGEAARIDQVKRLLQMSATNGPPIADRWQEAADE